MIYRGDVKEGEVISVRRVSPADLAEGKLLLLRQGASSRAT